MEGWKVKLGLERVLGRNRKASFAQCGAEGPVPSKPGSKFR